MLTFEPALRVRVFFAEGERVDHRDLGEALLQQAHDAGMDRATLSRSIDGFGPWEDVEPRGPYRHGVCLVVEIIGDERAAVSFRAWVREFALEAVVTTERVQLARGSSLSALP
ncbi:MAG: DUF190 domain-containing protein [Actinomycetota bacterium]|nr:DUF190 domain-containing protein [Actinomycetota bacterium]